MAEIKQSETRIIKRNEINLNPYNPKRHSEFEVKRQVKNIKENGFLGGVTWNIRTGNLIDGHRRIQALDIINKYDGTDPYDIKVEVVDFDEKTEKEQMTYMALGNSRADYNLVSAYIDDIDLTKIGVPDEDLKQLILLSESRNKAMSFDAMEDMTSDFLTPIKTKTNGDDNEYSSNELESEEEPTPIYDLERGEKSFEDIARERAEQPHQTKEEIKAEKQKCTNIADDRNTNNACYAMIRFESVEDKMLFCEAMGVPFENNVIIDGTEFLQQLN